MDPNDLVAIARLLAGGAISGSRGRPRQTELRRAISATYYAMFHTLASCCANSLAGYTLAKGSRRAWLQAYRALQHGDARQRCERTATIARFPIEVREFAQQFVQMQIQRHSADYDPTARFLRIDVVNHIEETENIISQFNSTARPDQRAFAIYVLLQSR